MSGRAGALRALAADGRFLATAPGEDVAAADLLDVKDRPPRVGVLLRFGDAQPPWLDPVRPAKNRVTTMSSPVD